MRIFKAIIEDYQGVYRIFRPAKSLKQFKEMYSGNGEFIKIEDVTESFKINISGLRNDLNAMHHKEDEIDIIISLIQSVGLDM